MPVCIHIKETEFRTFGIFCLCGTEHPINLWHKHYIICLTSCSVTKISTSYNLSRLYTMCLWHLTNMSPSLYLCLCYTFSPDFIQCVYDIYITKYVKISYVSMTPTSNNLLRFYKQKDMTSWQHTMKLKSLLQLWKYNIQKKKIKKIFFWEIVQNI